MFHVDIIVANSNHHAVMAVALSRWMVRRGGYKLRLLSLCEFGGVRTPTAPFDDVNVEVVRFTKLRRPSWAAPKRPGKFTEVARAMAWYTVLANNVRNIFAIHPDLVILFTDDSYPSNRICAVLGKRGIPFLLVQEGIRFEVEAGVEDSERLQGGGGAHAIAALGETSAEYFRRRGAPPETIHLTGNPRFEQVRTPDLELRAHEIKEELGLGCNNLLFLSNPIEFFGCCSTDKKLELIREFVLGIDPLFEETEFHLLFKLHPHERPEDFQRAVKDSPHADRIVIASRYELYPMLLLSEAAVMFGTTAGLEALLLGVPLGILEIPGVGFLHDYVSGGAALGITWKESLPDQVADLLGGKDGERLSVKHYLERTLAVRNGSTERIGELIESLVNRGPMRI